MEDKLSKSFVVCDQCGKKFFSSPCYQKRERKNRFCSKKCEAEFKKYYNTREQWRGGTIGTTTGYKYIRIDGKNVGEHILVAEKKIGRRLTEGEVVHHINGNKLDNRPENLIVMTKSQHAKLHGNSKKRIIMCNRCGKERQNHGRGLCPSCYHYEFVHGNLENYSKIREPKYEAEK